MPRRLSFRLRPPSSSFAALASVALLAAAGPAAAQGYEPPHSLRWPLSHGSPAVAREAIGSSFGEYQWYGDPAYVHTGIDIRGRTGDPVRLAAGGNIWLTANFDDDSCLVATNCRLYVKGSDRRYIYYYSHLRLAPAGEEFTSELREKIINAAGAPQHDPRPGTDVSEGQLLAGIADFAGGDWPHLHFGIVDATQSYDAINPLTALRRTGDGASLFDDERPTIAALELVRDGQHAALSTPACAAVSGAVDLAATMKDSFYTTSPAPAPVDGHIHSIGVYEASYLVRNVGTGATRAGTWYRFDRAPLRCAGPDRGLACLPNLSESDFFADSINRPDGALSVAEPYVGALFSTVRSQSPYNGPEEERYVHFLTNTWGREGRWNTADDPDGYYQVSVEARDEGGNAASLSRFVLVDNHGALAPQADAHVRDNAVDVGALPSTLGGEPFWTSPDIFVLPAGSPAPGPDDGPPEVLLAEGAPYEVYLRVTNGSCAPLEGIYAQIYSADPSTINSPASWGTITLPAGSFVSDAAHPSGLALGPGERALLGPFPWTPTHDEATSHEGHRCLLAKINAADDPVGSADVPDNNNVAQRNVQFSDTSSFSIGNPEPKRYNADFSLACNGFPFAEKGALMQLRVAYHPALAAAWSQAEGVKVKVEGDVITARFERCRVDLPPALLPGHTSLPASFTLVPPPNAKGQWRVDLSQRLNGIARGGMSFEARGI